MPNLIGRLLYPPVDPDNAGSLRPPECLDKDVFGGAGIPDNPQDPVKNLNLELPERRFECVLVALNEPPEEFAIELVRPRLPPCHYCLSACATAGMHTNI